jgi:long-chain acyl-CoA synthetase
MNIVSLLSRNASMFPNKFAVVYKDQAFDYSQLWRNVQIAANTLKSKGFVKGDKVVLFLENSAEFIFCFYGILMLGGVVVPLPSYLRLFEIRSIFSNCKPSFAITRPDIWERAISGRNFDTTLISVRQMDFGTNNPVVERITPVWPGMTASINYTYNGGGYPKGAELTHKNYLCALNGLVRHLGLQRQDIFLAPLPMAHVYALALANLVPILTAATTVITDTYFPSTIARLITEHNVTILVSVPSVFNLLNREFMKSVFRPQSLRFMITGGEYMPPSLQLSIIKNSNVPLVQGYGLTESMPIVCNVPHGPNKYGSLGIPGRPDIFVKIVDPEMQEVIDGDVGEILIKSPTNMVGYHNSPVDSDNAFYDGWLKTGDFGCVDQDGFLYFKGLKKRICNLSGLKVDPAELVKVGLSHPRVRSVTIRQEETEGALPMKSLVAELTISPGGKIEKKDFVDFFKSQLAWHKIPKRLVINKSCEITE